MRSTYTTVFGVRQPYTSFKIAQACKGCKNTENGDNKFLADWEIGRYNEGDELLV